MKKSFILLPTLLVSLASCGGNPDGGNSAGANKTLLNFIALQDTYSQTAMNKLIDTYNNGQGVTDGIYVNPTWANGEYGQYSSTLARSTKYNIVSVLESQFKPLAISNYFVKLDDPALLTDPIKTSLHYDEICTELKNTYSCNGSQKNAKGKYEAGAGTSLMGMPFSVNPQVLFYNEGILKRMGINIISIHEDELDAYNQTNNTHIMPHGYAEYKTAPFAEAVKSKNVNDEDVYKVFNNAIGMNWEELHCLSYYLQQKGGYNYGFMSEWWFHFGFSVGGDCIGWDEESNSYKFTVCDKNPNYLAIDNVTVNGTSYEKGRVLYYEDATFVNQDKADATTKAKLYELPSQYEAFLEFNRLGVPTNAVADGEQYGYGVAPNTTTNRAARFLTGTDCPFLIETISNLAAYQNTLGEDLNIAVAPQYREYVGGSVRGNKATIAGQSLKIIGETYDDVVYSGELKKAENGTPIVGEIQGAAASCALCIPSKSDSSKYAAAMKFISWACGEEGQKIVSSSNTSMPTYTGLLLDKNFYESSERIVPNTYAACLETLHADVGDYSYFQTKTWIDPWAQLLNVNVRQGNITLSDFMEEKMADANAALSAMTLRIYGR